MTKNGNSSDESFHSIESSQIRLIKFLLIILIEPFSLTLNLILIIYLIKDRRIRSSLHQHVVLLLLIVCFLTNSIEIPRILDYLFVGFVRPSTRSSCLIWQWCDYFFFALSNLLMFWASFERHLLVFHSTLFVKRSNRFLFHYFPLLFVHFYLILFYFSTIVISSCSPRYDYSVPLCGSPCFNDNSSLSLFDLFVHSWIPILLIGFFSLTLIIRVYLRQRILSRQLIQWRRYRRMIVQLLLISSIYLICLGPYTFIQIIDLIFSLPPSAKQIQNVHLFYLYWFLSLLFPFVSIHSLPEFKIKFYQFIRFYCSKSNLVSPISFHR